MAASGIPTVVIPGLHRGSPTDPRFKAYSHQTSPEKLGIAYLAVLEHGPDVVVADISSNTVSVLVRDGRVAGAFDACVFAPGMRHGALDVDAIRRIDLGEETANQAFLHAGVEYTMPEPERLRTIAMFAAMECAALLLLAPDATVVLAGSLAPAVADEVAGLLDRRVAVGDEWAAARGLVADRPRRLRRRRRDPRDPGRPLRPVAAGKRFISIYHVRLRDPLCRSYASTAGAARARSPRPN